MLRDSHRQARRREIASYGNPSKPSRKIERKPDLNDMLQELAASGQGANDADAMIPQTNKMQRGSKLGL